MPTFTTPEPVSVDLEVAGARVRVTASERTDTVVLVEPVDAASRKDLKVAEKTKVEFADGQLSVKTMAAGDKTGSVSVTIDLPTGSGLAAYLGYSSVQVDGALGEVDLHMASGQVELDRIAALQANVSSGEVAIGHISGRARIDGAAFTTRIGAVGGVVGFSNSGGRTWIGHAVSDLDLSSASGDFDVDRADGNVSVETANGAIRIGRMSNGQAKLRNASGNIEVRIAEGTAASVDVHSERGGVHNYVAANGEPGANDAKVSVFARTRHGDITVQRAAS